MTIIGHGGYHREAMQKELDSTTLPAMESQDESIPKSIVPYARDDDRSRYLGLRASGFSIREALGLIGKHKSTVSKWRLDPRFVELENSVPELRKTLALEYASLEFIRNYRLVLEKDFRVLKESLRSHSKVVGDGDSVKVVDTGMNGQDFQYLLKMRPLYTPQQLQAIEQLFGRGNDAGKEFNWTDIVMTLSRTKEEVKIETRKKSPSVLASTDGEEGEADLTLSPDETEIEPSKAEIVGQRVSLLDSSDTEDKKNETSDSEVQSCQ